MFGSGFEKKAKEALKGGKADGMPDKCFEKGELKKGKKHEAEHTKSKKAQKEIAKDHLAEDDDYYEKLEKMEKKSSALRVIKQIVKRIQSHGEAKEIQKSMDTLKKNREHMRPAGFHGGFQKVKK